MWFEGDAHAGCYVPRISLAKTKTCLETRVGEASPQCCECEFEELDIDVTSGRHTLIKSIEAFEAL